MEESNRHETVEKTLVALLPELNESELSEIITLICEKLEKHGQYLN